MELFTWIASNFPSLAIIALLLSCFFQVSKIPINPWDWLVKGVASIINKSVKDELHETVKEQNKQLAYIKDKVTTNQESISEIMSEIDNLYLDFDMNKIKSIRGEVLMFYQNVKSGYIFYTREQYHHIINLISDYHTLVNKRGIQNGVMELAEERIKEAYKECDENGKFD